MTEDELRAVVAAYDQAGEHIARLETQRRDTRDAEIQRAADEGMRQVDIIRVTGYSRETVRQALKPEAREAVRARRKSPKDAA
ncbi:hypothetical protein [Catenuloplanes japonicus]|uniref:hypothetical protein n=1 Tax=Catenuloplanes japonicus TaxID=33876 RepID=UPI000524FAAB|nr:hypothetical protein [Catenuloplanes japonicus]